MKIYLAKLKRSSLKIKDDYYRKIVYKINRDKVVQRNKKIINLITKL